MRILFYLPVITPWWFDEIIAPMLRTLHEVAQLHVMVAPWWRSTGIAGEQLEPIADLEHIDWHIIDGEDHPLFRTDGAALPGLLDLVERISPDLTLCRSAEQSTPAHFPGVVRYIMEGGAAPFETDPRWIVLEPSLFAYGAMPAGAAEIGASIADALTPLFHRAEQRLAAQPPSGWRAHYGLPEDRPILSVPLQYEHEEDFFVERSAFPRGVDLIYHLIRTLDDSAFLAITDHPLNRRFVDRSAVDALIAAHPDRARLCLGDGLPLGATGLIASRADAVLVDQSKCWSFAAFRGTPILHVGNFQLADWLGASRDLASFPSGLSRPDTMMGRSWFGWHLGTRLLNAQQFTPDDLMSRVSGTCDEAVIAANIDLLMAQPLKAAA
ncbi:MAG: hypothetical protein JF595_03200 [Sphingomonadales bacterium]|nr:hypothetical protein [Sphingomonadales bacterium]